jgi:hypothetical protein
MTSDEIKAAVKKMMAACDKKMAEYDSVSARGLLYELNYNKEQTDQVIEFLFKAGFNYCIDTMYPVKDPDTGKEEPTPAFACVWGPDQLKSRLHWCV